MLILNPTLIAKYYGPEGGNEKRAAAKVETGMDVKPDVIDSNDLSKKENRNKLYDKAQQLITELEQRGDQMNADRLKKVLKSAQTNEQDPVVMPENIAARLQRRMEFILHPPVAVAKRPQLTAQQGEKLAAHLDALGAAKTAKDAQDYANLPKFGA